MLLLTPISVKLHFHLRPPFRCLMGMATEQIPAVHVTDGQEIAVEPVSHLEVTLVVGTPNLVRLPRNGLGTSGMFSPKSSLAARDEALPFQDIRCRGYCW